MFQALPKYWKQCAEVQQTMQVEQTKVRYGKHARQYSIVVRNQAPHLRRPNRYMFYFHGGGWTFGKPETFTPAAIPWLRLGFTVILPSYRRPPMVGLRRIVQDCWQAVNYFAQEAGEDPLIHIGGISAGGHLAAVLATQPEEWLQGGWPTPPRKALICAGPLTLKELTGGSFLLPYYNRVDPIQLLRTPNPALPLDWQLLHGTIDPVVPVIHSQVFLKKLTQLGYSAKLELLEGKRHLDAGRWMFGELASEVVEKFICRS